MQKCLSSNHRNIFFSFFMYTFLNVPKSLRREKYALKKERARINWIKTNFLQKPTLCNYKAPDCDTKFELLSELSPKLGPDFGPILMEILSVNKNSFQLQKSLIGYADTELINSLKVEFLAEIMALENNDGTVVCTSNAWSRVHLLEAFFFFWKPNSL